jgi:hypothetical protein
VWQHFCELKTKPIRVLKTQNGIAIDFCKSQQSDRFAGF